MSVDTFKMAKDCLVGLHQFTSNCAADQVEKVFSEGKKLEGLSTEDMCALLGHVYHIARVDENIYQTERARRIQVSFAKAGFFKKLAHKLMFWKKKDSFEEAFNEATADDEVKHAQAEVDKILKLMPEVKKVLDKSKNT